MRSFRRSDRFCAGRFFGPFGNDRIGTCAFIFSFLTAGTPAQRSTVCMRAQLIAATPGSPKSTK